MSISSEIINEIESLIATENNNVANMANLSAHLFEKVGWHWVGFYLVDESRDELVLGPFQGPVACTRLKKGVGVCAKSWVESSTAYVPNVHDFSGHVACSPLSNSELVIPIRSGKKVVAVLDIDSEELDGFSSEEIKILETVVSKLEARWEE